MVIPVAVSMDCSVELTIISPLHSYRQWWANSWLVPPPHKTLEQAKCMRSSTAKAREKKMILHTVMTIRKCIIKICNTWRQNMVVSVFWYVFIIHDSTKLHTPAVKSIPQYCNIYILWIEILMKSRFFPLRPLSFIKPFTAPPSACHYISFRFHFIFSKTLR